MEQSDPESRIKELELELSNLKSCIKAAKQTEKALQESEERFRLLFDKAPLGYQSLDNDGKFIEVNQTWLDALGYTREEVIGKWFGDFLSPAYQDGFRKRFPIFKEQGHIHSEFEIVCKNGNILFIAFEGRIGTDLNGEFKQTHCILEDITERKKAVEALTESQNLLQKAENMSNQGSWKWDVINDEWYFSENWLKIHGFEKSKISKEELMEIAHPDDTSKIDIAFDNALRNKKPYLLEHRIIRKDNGEVRVIKAVGEVHFLDNGKPDFMIGVAQDITQKKHHENELIKAKEKAKEKDQKLIQSDRVFNLTLDMFCIAGFDGYFKYLNPAWERTLGWSIEELLSKPWLDFVHPDDAENTENIKSVIVDGKEIYKFENRYISKDGSIKWLSWNSQPFPKENIMIGAVRDITQQKKIELELIKAKEAAEESGKKYKRLIDNSNSIIMEIDMDTLEIVNCNLQMAKHFNKNVSDFIGVDVRQILPTEVLKKRIECAEKALQENKVQQFKDERNGKHFLHSYIPYKIHNNKFVQTVTHDITLLENAKQELIKAKEKAEESENRLIEAQRIAKLGNWYIDFQDGHLNWSKDCYSIFEINENVKKEELRKTLSEKIHPEDLIQLDIRNKQAIENVEGFKFEYRAILKNGVKNILLISEPVLNSENKLIGTKGTIQDVTEQIQTELALIRAKEDAENANQLKAEFLQNMSHEIRTPLNGIMGFAEILNNPKLSEEKRNNYSKIIRNSGEQLLRIIDDILEISTLETKQTKLDETEFCLNDLLMELFSIFNLNSAEKNVPIYLEKPLHDKQVLIISDKTKLNKILSNLIENALKFTTQGSIEIGYRVEEDFIKLYVRDTGIGISAENQQKIFERFSQENKDIAETYGGLGLGLSICKENAQLLGGDITLESQKGSGSKFIVTIPYKPAGNSAPDVTNYYAKHPATDSVKTILVAEDEEMNYLYIEALFEDEVEFNYNLIHAKNGKEALDICLKNQDIDVVLMDIKMPVMNGNTATQMIKKRFPDLPVIAQTAYSTDSEKAEAMKHGYNDFMSKPIDKDRLFETINKYVSVK